MKTTEKDFALFKQCCEEWLDRLGLSDWDVILRHDNIHDEDGENTDGCVEADVSAKRAIIVLNKEMVVMTDKEDELRSTAFHEVMEIVLLEYQEVSEFRNERDMERVKHGIINRLWKVFGKEFA